MALNSILIWIVGTDVTSLQVDLTQPITFKMMISLIISDAHLLSSSLEITYLMSNLRYFNLKALIIPASKGCNLDVMILGRNTNLMFDKFFSFDSWWLEALSRNRKTFRFCIFILQSRLFNTSSIISLFIQALLFAK